MILIVSVCNNGNKYIFLGPLTLFYQFSIEFLTMNIEKLVQPGTTEEIILHFYIFGKETCTSPLWTN